MKPMLHSPCANHGNTQVHATELATQPAAFDKQHGIDGMGSSEMIRLVVMPGTTPTAGTKKIRKLWKQKKQ
ncbi:MAG: hypothetical protein A2Y12_03500 [Planctomycetes bacterium GWF2_42_9]|nr:MAG: hypothetical protein A2Y12_03500 [Planctomycetes bacterium GWF2_42_9]